MHIKKEVDKAALVRQIVEMELKMFQSVPAAGESQCREHPDLFRLHRRAQFSIFSKDTLNSYLDDLLRARKENINLMTIKYALMDNLIPRFNTDPLIEEIAAIMIDWQIEIARKYPSFMKGARPVDSSRDSQDMTSFETYLMGELETYSDKTLSLLIRDLKKLKEAGVNGSEEVYKFLIQSVGSQT